jgi:hypothetical protein
MNTFKKILTLSLSMVMLCIASCVDKDFDEPPVSGIDPAIAVTHTIDQIKSYYVAGAATPLPGGSVIAGVVISDDVEGNFYKDLVIEDATGGILIRVDVSPLSANYPKGRRVFIKCTGLVISDYGGMYQIGVDDGNNGAARIPSSLVDTYIFPGMWNQTFPVKTVSDLTALGAPSVATQNIAVRLNNVHFETPCDNFADATASGNRTLLDAGGNPITVRTSNYSTFAFTRIPAGTGTVDGVLQEFNGAYQLIIRDLNDLQGFNFAACNPAGPAHTIQEVRNLYNGFTTSIGANSEIEGIVISDRSTSNLNNQNMVLQQGDFGIVVRFTAAHSFNLGDKVKVNVSGQELSEFNAVLEVNNVDLSLATKTGTGSITPRNIVLSDIAANGETWESTLVKISNVTISGSGIYSGSNTLTDATGTMPLYTSSTATFAGASYPATPVSVTGIINDHNGKELNIRSTNDVQ